jgi:hypothetical protein
MPSHHHCLAAALALTSVAFSLPGAAMARDDDRREVRVNGSCGPGATSKLKLKQRDGRIEAEFEVDRNRSGERWSVIFIHEGRVTHRIAARTSGASGSFSVERRVADLSGADRVSARAPGPGGRSCAASAVLPA